MLDDDDIKDLEKQSDDENNNEDNNNNNNNLNNNNNKKESNFNNKISIKSNNNNNNKHLNTQQKISGLKSLIIKPKNKPENNQKSESKERKSIKTTITQIDTKNKEHDEKKSIKTTMGLKRPSQLNSLLHKKENNNNNNSNNNNNNEEFLNSRTRTSQRFSGVRSLLKSNESNTEKDKKSILSPNSHKQSLISSNKNIFSPKSRESFSSNNNESPNKNKRNSKKIDDDKISMRTAPIKIVDPNESLDFTKITSSKHKKKEDSNNKIIKEENSEEEEKIFSPKKSDEKSDENSDEIMNEDKVNIESIKEYEPTLNSLNYSDKLIENFFEKNNFESPNFFNDIAKEIQHGQIELNNELENMIKDDKINTKKLNIKKEEYIKKLDLIKDFHNNFEEKVNNLNELYSDKLSYVSLLSKNLFEFEKVNKNIEFTKKSYEIIKILNETEDLLKIPEIFRDSEKILTEGVEMYLSFKNLLETMKKKPEYSNFVNNIEKIEDKIKNHAKESIKKFYNEDDYEQLQNMFLVTETIHNEFLIDLYVNFITTDLMKLDESIQSIEKVKFNLESVSEELFTLIFKISDDFHENILNFSSEQFGTEYSKIYLLFPESRQKLVISKLVSKCLEKLNKFRENFIDDTNKNDETFVRIVHFIYPKENKFLEKFKQILIYSKSDLGINLEQETNIFLRTVEAVYMSKEKSLINNFIETTYKNKILKLLEMKEEYLESMKIKKNKNNNFCMEKLLNDFFNLIQGTNFSALYNKSNVIIGRYNILISRKEEKNDLIETFCREVFDSIENLLSEFCNLEKFIINESLKKDFEINEKYFLLLSKIHYCNSQFKQIFIYDLREFFRNLNFMEIIEDYVENCTNKIELNIDNLFSDLNSFVSINFTKLLKSIKYKENYKIKKNNLIECSSDFEKIYNFLLKFFTAINNNWQGLEKYKNMIYLLFTNLIVDKMKEILKNCKLNNDGVIVLKNDFQKISNLFAKFTEEYYYNKIYDVVFLTEIFTTRNEDLDEFVKSINKDNKYEPDLIKLVIKKRKGLKND